MMKRAMVILLSLALEMALLWMIIMSVFVQPVRDTLLPPMTNTDGRAGLSYSFYPGPEGEDRYYLPLAVQAGSRWDRFDFSWARLEPVDNAWDFSPYDTLVNDLHNGGIQNIVGILQMTPDWAATQCVMEQNVSTLQQSGSGHLAAPRPFFEPLSDPLSQIAWEDGLARMPPIGLYHPWTVENFNGNQWAEFVYTVVSRYKDQVKSWEMWNEVEWDSFWCGSEGDYAQLLKVGYQATKAACPDCTVLFAGLYPWADLTFFERVLDIINDDPDAPANNDFFDVMSIHLYGRSDDAYSVVNYLRNRMLLYVLDHPIWLTETGVPVWGDPQAYNAKYDYAATQDEVAAYVIQSYANALASGVERYFFFRTNDADMGEYFGLIRNDGSLRPAYNAYQVATTYLISPTFTTRVPTGANLRVTLWGTPRGKVSVLWNTGPLTSVHTLPATIPNATLVNRWGVTHTLTATAGVYTLTLPGATANLVTNPDDYIIGGDPVILIESEAINQPPTSTVRQLPEVTYTMAFTVTWEGQDNESGVWLYDIEVRDGEDGTWALWQHSTTTTAGIFTGTIGHSYYFRSRATDRVGNREEWPTAPQAWTTLGLTSTLHLAVGPFFADENRNGIWDIPGTQTGEIVLTGVSLRFLDSLGRDVVSPVVADTWEFTTTILIGEAYRLKMTAATTTTDYMRSLSFTWPPGEDVYTESLGMVGLWPARRVYLPLGMRH
ncbi:MAG: glycosyl hydrolase [Anaerolineae bacterium]